MAKYSLSVVAPAANTNTPLAVIRAGAARIRVKRIKLVCTTAVASSIGLVRPSAVGTPTTSALFQAHQATDAASVTNLDSVWSAAPTLGGGALYLERATMGGVVGNGDVWTFQDEIYIEPGQALVLWNFGAGTSAAIQVSATIEE